MAKQQSLILKVKKLSADAIIPTKNKATDAGFDLYLHNRESVPSFGVKALGTGIAVEIPEGYYGQLLERSGLSLNNTLKIKAGVIDSGYRGEVKVIFQNCADYPVSLEKDIKFAQLVILPVPEVTIEEVTTLSESERGTAGFGSSGV